MSQPLADEAAQFYADTYDAATPDWPAEIAFYQQLAVEALGAGGAILELGCGTGRVAIRLAQSGASVVGLDLSAQMIEAARRKSAGLDNIRWLCGDMRRFRLGQQFALILIPGHSFQHLNSAGDQVACLRCIERHLLPGGRLVVHLDHQDVRWLGGLLNGQGGMFQAAEQFRHPATGHLVQALRAWSYEPATQTAVSKTMWEERGEDGSLVRRWQSAPRRLHCLFRFEMEHLLARAGFAVEAVYGAFSCTPLTDASSEMIWLARRRTRASLALPGRPCVTPAPDQRRAVPGQ